MGELADKIKNIFAVDRIAPLIIVAYAVAVGASFGYAAYRIKSSFDEPKVIEYQEQIRLNDAGFQLVF